MARKRVGNKREKIIAAAAKFFGEKGYHNTTTAEVAEAAGVAAGTIYIYFSSKEDLLVAVFEEFLEKHMLRLREGVDKEVGPEARLRRLIVLGLALMEENPDSARIFLSQLRQSTTMIKMVAKRSSRAYRGIIESILDEGIRAGLFRPMDTHAVAAMVFGAFQNLVLDWVADDCSYRLTGLAEEATTYILRGAACPEQLGDSAAGRA
jgi:TetR/AcrR family transcriptional regulator, fatty acid metabolism regulator protein